MERDFQRIVFLKQIQKRQVAVLIRLLYRAVEVANRLMVMKSKYKSETVCHRDITARASSPLNKVWFKVFNDSIC